MIRKFTVAFHTAGALAANHNYRFTAPSECTLAHVSAVASNDSDALITIGTSADVDGWLASCVIGDSDVPVEKGIADFDGALLSDAGNEPPRAIDGTVIVVVLDYDGASGTAAEDFTLVLTFQEG